MQHSIRKATRSELHALARLWYDGWQVAHAAHVPASLTEIRTLDSFQRRLLDNFENIRVIGVIGTPLGLCMIKENEINQIFVSPAAQGTGAAATLITDGLARIHDGGISAHFWM